MERYMEPSFEPHSHPRWQAQDILVGHDLGVRGACPREQGVGDDCEPETGPTREDKRGLAPTGSNWLLWSSCLGRRTPVP